MSAKRGFQRTTFDQGYAAILVLLIVSYTLADDNESKRFATFRHRSIAPIEESYQRIAAAHSDDPAFAAYRQRLEIVHQLVDQLVTTFERVKASSYENLLGEIADLPLEGINEGESIHLLSPFEILAEYEEAFAEPLPMLNTSKENLDLLRRYYDTSVSVAGQYIAQRGGVVARIDEQSATDILELCLVVPFLHYPDEQWSKKHIKTLSDWMKRPRYVGYMENFCLRTLRPNSAYRFARFLHKGQGDVTDQAAYVKYLASSAEKMSKDREYHAAIRCLETAIARAPHSTQHVEVANLRFELAKLYHDIGHPSVAADEVNLVLTADSDTETWAQAAMLRFKYLYASKNLEQMVTEAPQLLADRRCEPYRPQMMYVAWRAYRQQGLAEQAEKLRQQFMKRYQDHPLAANVYLVMAEGSIVAGDYDEAARLLEIIEYRHPNSKLIPAVKRIQKRLAMAERGTSSE